jgi:spore germination cell wall hydrolase CwlJ-like protein
MPHARAILAVAPRPIAEPTKIAAFTPDQARTSNLAVPIVPGAVRGAPPFVYAGNPQDRASAQTCLAAAVYYEAGDDAVGEQAVAQIIINRLRHPAFAKTICGVVFQGSERKTGCQFTFSCDGSLSRRPPPAAWKRAEDIAGLALSGTVARSVGLATYYHADWVVPYWRDSLDKIAVLHGHIFYRWRGRWGRLPAFAGRSSSPEVLDPRIATLAVPAVTATLPDDTDGPARTSVSIFGVPRAALKGAIVRLKDDDAGQYVLQLAPSAPAGSFAVTAFTICAEKADCLVMAWADEKDVPRALPILPLAMRTMVFMYRKSSVLGDARPYWDCRRYPRAVKGQCLPGTGQLGPQ